MFCASASFSCCTTSPRNGSTASVPSHGDSQRASWKPLSKNTRTASSSSTSLVPPRMTRATGFRTFGARSTYEIAREVLLAPEAPYPPGRKKSQGFLQPHREAFRDTELHYVLHRRLADRLHRAEVSQEDALSRGPDAFDRVERGRQRLARSDLPVVGDREAMRLVPNPLHQEHNRRVPLLDDRLSPSRREDLLPLLGQRKRRDVGVAGRL